jgi:membrane protease YdiL (CAAX protease family)
MLALVLLVLVPVLMWGVQSAALWYAGEPLRWQLNPENLPPLARQLGRITTKAAFVLVLLLYPLLRGESPFAYYTQFFPLHSRPTELLIGAAAAILYLSLLYLAWAGADVVQFQVRHTASRLARRLAGAPLTALFIALAEEMLFRAMLLADLLRTVPPVAAIALGVAAFAGAHYVRRVKRYWTFPGHLALGALLCLSFYWTHALWLPLGLHAAGVLVLTAVRPFVRYTGPAWLVGASIFPYAGVVGFAALILLTINMWLRFGGVI